MDNINLTKTSITKKPNYWKYVSIVLSIIIILLLIFHIQTKKDDNMIVH